MCLFITHMNMKNEFVCLFDDIKLKLKFWLLIVNIILYSCEGREP